jgi:hypothetical protein
VRRKAGDGMERWGHFSPGLEDGVFLVYILSGYIEHKEGFNLDIA